MLLNGQASPALRHDFLSNVEAEEYAKQFLSDMCFWERASSVSGGDEQSSMNSQQSREATERAALCERDDSSASSQSESEEHIVKEEDLTWKTAVDPVSGRTYYYSSLTRETQWEKPEELKSWERQVKKARIKKDKAFFRKMEKNILASLSRGELIPGVAPSKMDSLSQPLMEQQSSVDVLKTNNSNRVRTLSGMDERVLESLNNRGSFLGASTTASSSSASTNSQQTRGVGRTTARVQTDKRSGAGVLPASHRPPLPQQSRSNQQTIENKSAAKEKVESIPRPLSLNSHLRRNTGGTVFVKSTMANPDVKATIKCVCGAYRAHIVQGQEGKRTRATSLNTIRVNLEIFQDDYELPRRTRGQILMPSVEEISTFFYEYFCKSQMEHDTIIMTLIYVERLIKTTNGILAPTPENWRSLLFSCMIMASKVWDDLSMWNIDFSNVSVATGIAPFSLHRINQLELALLTCLGFDVRVTASEYAKYYFLIRNMLIRSGLLENGAGTPSIKEEAQVLERFISQYENAFVSSSSTTSSGRRTQSADWQWFHGQGQKAGTSKGSENNLICLEQ